MNIAAAFAIIPLLVVALRVCAQPSTPEPLVVAEKKTAPGKVYTFVEQMPELPGGGGNQAVVAFLLKALRVPKLNDQPSWPRTKVSFIVGPDGRVYDEQVFLQEPIPEYHRAMFVAVRKLPRFKPGYQARKPVAVKLTIAFSCIMVQ